MNAVWVPAAQAKTGDCWRASLDQCYALRVTVTAAPDPDLAKAGWVRLAFDDGEENGYQDFAPTTAILVIRSV